jgi:hypothetical protein
MRIRIKKQTTKIEQVNLAHLKAYQIKGRSKASVMYRLSQMRAYEIKVMFSNLSVSEELQSRLEARMNVPYFVAASKLIYKS